MEICNSCNRKIENFSQKNYTKSSKRYNWIHDSTVRLAGINDCDVFYGYCFNCFHTSILPRFNTNKLYQKKRGFTERKKAYEYHNPGKIYGKSKNSQMQSGDLEKIEFEFTRISNITKQIMKIIDNSFDSKKIINVIDYGGGDGYLVKIIEELINSKTNFNLGYKVNSFVHDPAYKGKNKIAKADIIILSHVLEHVHDLDNFFINLSRLTNNKTVFLIEVPDERLKLLRTVLFRKKVYFDFHVNIFTKRSLEQLFAKHGLGSQFNYKSTPYRGIRANVINGIAEKKLKINSTQKLVELFELIKLIFSKVKIKILNSL